MCSTDTPGGVRGVRGPPSLVAVLLWVGEGTGLFGETGRVVSGDAHSHVGDRGGPGMEGCSVVPLPVDHGFHFKRFAFEVPSEVRDPSPLSVVNGWSPGGWGR